MKPKITSSKYLHELNLKNFLTEDYCFHCGISEWKIIITNQSSLFACNLAKGMDWPAQNDKNIHFIQSTVFTDLSILLIEVEWKLFVHKAFANYTKLPIIQMVMFQVLGFYGYDDRGEQAANLLFLAGIQSPLIKSLPSL